MANNSLSNRESNPYIDNLMRKAREDYGFISQHNPAVVLENGPGFAETYSADETGTPDYPRHVLGVFGGLLGKLTGGRIKLDDVLKDLKMEEYAGAAVDKALNYAMKRTGIDYNQLSNVQMKSQVLQYAAQFLASQYPEVVKWVDTDANGVIDWVETRLPVPLPAPVYETTEAMAFSSKPKAPRAPRQVRSVPDNSQPG